MSGTIHLGGGGDTFRLLDRVRRAGSEQPVRDFVARGGDYDGGGAGALLACADIGVRRPGERWRTA